MKKRLPVLLCLILMTAALMYPYIVKDLLAIEHDTFFHVSRIEQLSIALKNGQILPAVYPYENNGYGYASALFYSDVLLIPAALLHLAGIAVSTCYKFTVIMASFFSGLTMYLLAQAVTKRRDASLLASAAYLFANYHITDIFVRGALGEVLALAVLPLTVLGMYRILFEKNVRAWPVLTAGLSLLALSHNLTFLMGSILCAILFFLNLRKVNTEIFVSLCKGVFTAFLLTAFYTIPMIEQLSSQEFIVDYYAANSSLQFHSMDLWQYFANTTVFGLAGNYLERDRTMLENVGIFLTFAPVLWFFVKERKNSPFVTELCLLGYLFFLLPCSLLPYEKLTFLRVMQFPWRFNTLAILLLSVPAAYAVVKLTENKALAGLVILVLAGECVWHVYPATQRTFGIPSSMSWSEVQEGALCDPYYSASYMRVELAGGDYLPLHSPDFRGRSTALRSIDDVELSIPYTRDYTDFTFEKNDGDPDEIVLPLTFYKGYTAYLEKDGTRVKADCTETSQGLVLVLAEENGTYHVTYENTLLRKGCILLSLLTALLLLFKAYKKQTS